MKHLLIVLLTVTAIFANAQDDKCISVFPNGHFLKFFPYTFYFENPDSILMTYNDAPLQRYGDGFVFYERKNSFGMLKAYNVTQKDTALFFEKKLRFVDPTFTIEFAGHQSGDTISRDEFKNKWFSVYLLNNEMSFSIPIEEAYLLYPENGELKKVKLGTPTEYDLPYDFIRYVVDSNSSFFILDVTIKFGWINHLPPVVFYVND
ncbi:hypothetical protein F0919_01910 [Taibaiella lutea]|uniref:Uncharacterized protein n=1 Tax=Taibaiella lutea TaxID=2608001 RepID=A0A5M6CTW0_9BACT|nr:hypothetical protein [Taibaiella lutea]KAA5536445.1 hypothetical protein F0919_01910 [Taibaiella lutea]